MHCGKHGIKDIIILIVLFVIYHNFYSPIFEKHKILLSALEGIGAGYLLNQKQINYYDVSKRRIEIMKARHNFNNYIWVYDELIFPLYDTVNSYVRSERGPRKLYDYDKNKWCYEFHDGVDIVPIYDYRVIASHDGTVDLYEDKIYGKSIILRNKAFITKYSHLASYKVNNNDFVNQGSIIGIIGNTGRAFGPHLDFEILVDDKKVNCFATSTYNKRVF
jgi:murein DD-endopeptidase MepM/ murein hydrolase activator NlpD